MAERIASGEVFVGVDDATAIAGLRNVDREFDRTMRKIDGKQAEAHVSVDLKRLKGELAEASAELEKWRAREKAAETKDQRYYRSQRRKEAQENFNAVANRTRASVRELQALKAQNKERDLGTQKEKALEGAMRRRAREADKMAVQMAKAAEADRTADLDKAKRLELIAQKQRQYARETDRLENIQRRKRKTLIGSETREKVELDERGVKLKMLRLVEELRLLGSHPPVKIRVDTDMRDVGIARRALFSVQRSATNALEKLSSIGHVRLNLGPFSGTIRTMTIAVGALAPILTSVTLAAGSLVGVIGAGISGAAAVGAAGVIGLGGAFLGLKFATRNTGQEIKNARLAINALQKAQEKYGKNSDKAKAKQKELNNTLKSISPLARESALGIERFFKNFDKHSGPTRKNLGGIAKDGFKALNALTPMWAAHTNKLSGILRDNLHKGFDFLSKGPGKEILSHIFANFNRSLPAALRGLGDFGHAFLNFGREGSKFLPMMTHGFENLGKKLLAFTQGDNFGATVKRWVNDARDLVRFFGAAGRVVMHFFGDGSKAGDKFVTDMTSGLNKWDKFLTSTAGKNRLGGMFQEAVKATESLGRAVGPILKAFTEWSMALAPFTKGILDVIGFVTQIVGAITHVVALKGWMAALGETVAIAFAVTKITAFVNMLIKAYDLVKAITAAMLTEQLAGGGLFAQAGAGLGALRKGKGFSTLAAEAEAAGAGAGAAKAGTAAEKAAGQWRSFEVAAADGGEAAVGAGVGAEAAAGGLGILSTAALVAVPAVIAVGGAYLIYKHHISQAAKAVQGYLSVDDKMNAAIQQQIAAESHAAKTHDKYAAATRGVRRAEKDVAATRNKAGKKGVESFIDAEARLYQQSQRQAKERSKFIAQSKQAAQGIQKQVSAQNELIQKRRDDVNKLQEQAKNEKIVNADHKASESTLRDLAKAQSLLTAETNAMAQIQDRAATAAINHQRALKGIGPIAAEAAQQVGHFAQQFGKIPSVKKILLSANTSQLSKIASESNKLNQSVGKTATKNVLVNAKSADDAIKKLEAVNGFTFRNKNVPITSPNAGKVLVQLAKLEGVRLGPKTIKAALAGDPQVLRRLEKLLGFHLPDKKVNVRAFTDQAIAAVRRVAAELAALHDKTVNVTTVHRTRGGGSFPIAQGGASGAVMGSAAKRDNNVPASMSSRTAGGRYRRPTFLVGEERRPEFVIATNPAYRKDNVSYWMQAARALGIPGFAAGGTTHGSFGPPDSPGYSANLNVLGQQKAGLTYGSKRSKWKNFKATKRTKKFRKDLKTDDPYATRVKSLLKQQDDIEREISIREGEQPDEPDSFLTPIGKYPDGSVKYEVDEGAVSKYADSFNTIIEAQNSLVGVLREIVNTIPLAIKSLIGRKAIARDKANSLTKEISRQETSLKNELALPKKKQNADKISKLRRAIARNKDDLKTTKRQLGNAQEDLNTMKDARPEAGFDYREAADSLASTQSKQAGVQGIADSQLKDTLPPDDTGGTSDTTPDMQAQLDQANTNLVTAQNAAAINAAALTAFGGPGDIGTGGFANAYTAAIGTPTVRGVGSALSRAGSAVFPTSAGGFLSRTPPSATFSGLGGTSGSGNAANAIVAGGSGAQAGGAGGPIILIQTLHPADPATLKAIGQAATGGISLQGNVISPRVATGL